MSNQNFSMTAPNGGDFQKRDKNPNIEPVPFGTQPCRLYAIIDMGTQESVYPAGSTNIQQSHKIKFMFEFPLHRQLFYLDDTEHKPSVLSMEFAFMMYVNKGKKTKMLQFIEGIVGPLQPAQYNTFDVSQLLGHQFLANIVHKNKANGGGVYANIMGISPFNANFYPNEMQNGWLNPINPTVLYSLSMGFNTEGFARMSYYDRKNLKASLEGIEYTNRGGKFVKFDDNGVLVTDDQTAPLQSQKQIQDGAAPAPNNNAAQNYQQQMQSYQQPGQPQAPTGYGQPNGQPVQQPPQVGQQGYNPQQGQPYGQQQPAQGFQPQTQAPHGFNQPPAGFNQTAPQQTFQQQPAYNPAQLPMGQTNEPAGMQGQPAQGYGNSVPAPAANAPQGFYQPQQPMAPVGQPQSAMNPAQQFQQTPAPSNPPAATPANQFQNGGQPGFAPANTAPVANGIQQPVGGMPANTNMAPPAGTPAPANYGAPQNGVMQGNMFEAAGSFKEEEHDDLPF